MSAECYENVDLEMHGIRVQRDIAVKSSRNDHTVRLVPEVTEAF